MWHQDTMISIFYNNSSLYISFFTKDQGERNVINSFSEQGFGFEIHKNTTL